MREVIRAYAVPQVRRAEQEAMAALPEGALMARAAEGLAAVVSARAQERGARTVVVLAGPGDNGGDAMYAAAHLAADQLAVTVVGLVDRLHPGALAAAEEAGVVVHRAQAAPVGGAPAPGGPAGDDAGPLSEEARSALSGADLVVDGMLGIGGRPGLRGSMAAAADAIDDDSYVVAVDLPSGADPEGQEPLRRAVFADETVTFGVPKPVHLLPATEAAVGRLTVVGIGIVAPVPATVERLTHDDVAALWPVPGPADDKYTRGVVGVVAGSDTYPGAAVLATTAAVGAGAGMVRYLGPQHATDLVVGACPEVVPGPGRVQAWVLGPGLDASDDSDDGLAQADAVREALAGDEPCLVDAGALDLFSPRTATTLLTPHAGELARLLTRLGAGEVTRGQVTGQPLRHARRAAELTGAVVLLKGSTTLVVPPAGPVRSQADAPPWLATAGAGDVLAGLAGTLLAAGLQPVAAGSLSALVHGVAADRANPGGPVRALAVAHGIPGAVAHLLRR